MITADWIKKTSSKFLEEFPDYIESTKTGFLEFLKKWIPKVDFKKIKNKVVHRFVELITNDVGTFIRENSTLLKIGSFCFGIIDCIMKGTAPWPLVFFFLQDALNDASIAMHIAAITQLVSSGLSFFFRKKNDIVSEGLIDDAKLAFETVVSSKAAQALKVLLTGVVGLKFFSKDVSMTLSSFLSRERDKPAPLYDVFTGALDLVSVLFEGTNLLTKGEDFWTVLTQGSDSQLQRFRTYVLQANNTFDLIPVKGKINRREYLVNVKQLRDAALESSRIIGLQYARLQEKWLIINGCNEILTRARNKQLAQCRMQPMFFCIAGAPGIGKGILRDYIPKLYCDLMQVKFDPGSVHVWTGRDDFWSGYDPEKHICVAVPEMASLHVKIAAAQGDTRMDSMMSVCDSNTLPLNMADLKDKGTTFFASEILVGETNVYDGTIASLHAGTTQAAPAALMRRPIFIVAKVREQYCIPGTSQVNPDHGLGPAELLKIYSFEVHRHLAADEMGKTTKKVVLMRGDIYELTQFLLGYMAKYVRHEVKMRQLRNGNEHEGSVSIYDLYGSNLEYSESIFDELFPMVDSDELPTSVRDANARILDGDLPAPVLHREARRVAKFAGEPCEPVLGDDDIIPDPEHDPDDIPHSVDEDGSGDEFDEEPLYRNDDNYGAEEFNEIHMDVEEFKVEGDEEPLSDEEILRELQKLDVEKRSSASNSSLARYRARGNAVLEFAAKSLQQVSEPILSAKVWTEFMAAMAMKYGSWRLRKAFRRRVAKEVVDDIRIFVQKLRHRGCMLMIALTILNVCLFFIGWNMSIVGIAMMWTIAWALISALETLVGILHKQIIEPIDDADVVLSNITEIWQAGAFENVKYYALAAATTGIAGLLIVLHCVRPQIVSEGDVRKKSNMEKKEYGLIETEIRYKNKLFEGYARRQVQIVVPFSQKANVLYPMIKRNTLRVRIEKSHFLYSKRVITTNMLGVKGSWALINTHTLPDLPFEIFHAPIGDVEEVQKPRCVRVVDPSQIVKVCDDVSMISLDSKVFRDISHGFGDPLPQDFVGMGVLCPTRGVAENVMLVSFPKASADGGKVTVENAYAYDFADHKSGDCGSALLADVSGGSMIVGIHFAGSASGPSCFAASVHKADLMRALSTARTNLTLSEGYGRERVAPHPKAPELYEDVSNVDYYGADPNVPVLANGKSKLVPTRFGEECKDVLGSVTGVKPMEIFAPPLMSHYRDPYVNPMNLFVNKINEVRAPLRRDVMDQVVNYISNRIRKIWLDDGMPIIQPATSYEAINGVIGNDYFNMINANASGGYGFDGKKDHFLPMGGGFKRDWTDEVEDTIVSIEDCYENEISAEPLYMACLKDEPRLLAKVKAGKTRVFTFPNVATYIMARRFHSPLISYFVHKRFGMAVGIDMHRDGSDVWRELGDFSDLCFDGDWSGYDTHMPVLVGIAANEIWYNFAVDVGYNDKALRMLKGVLHDSLFVRLLIYNGEFGVPGFQPSGKVGTAEDNSLRNYIMAVYFWFDSNLNRFGDFDDFIKAYFYGDDMIFAVKKEVSHLFNFQIYSAYAKANFDMEMTTARKDGTSPRFTSLSEITFLKRSCITNEHMLKGKSCPLDVNSLAKALMWRLPSNAVSEEMQMLDTCSSMVRELFFFNVVEGNFDVFRSYIIDVLMNKYKLPKRLVEERLPTFSFLCEEYGSASAHRGSDAIAC